MAMMMQEYGYVESCHARLLVALHQTLLAEGLEYKGTEEHDDDNANGSTSGTSRTSGAARFVASAAGAFPPLVYRHKDVNDGRLREIVINAVAMFDDLIVHATATCAPPAANNRQATSRADALSGCSDSGDRAAVREEGVQTEGAGSDGASSAEVVFVRPSSRRILFEQVSSWLLEDIQPHTQVTHQDDGTRTEAADELGQSSGEASLGMFATGRSSTKEAFRSRVLHGLLLHLCPPPGQFADIFGIEEGLRLRILGMLGARDLVALGMASRAANVSAKEDSLWAALVGADFSEREQAYLGFLRPRPAPAPTGTESMAATGPQAAGSVTAGPSDGTSAGGSGGSRAPMPSRPHAEGESGACGSDIGSGPSGGERAVRGEAQESSPGFDSRGLYVRLHKERARRASGRGRFSRPPWMLYRAGFFCGGIPYLPHGPYYAPDPAFPEIRPDMGFPIGDDGVDLEGPGYPDPYWDEAATGWARSRLAGPWREFGDGAMSAGGLGMGGRGWGANGQAGMPVMPPPHLLTGRRNRFRLF